MGLQSSVTFVIQGGINSIIEHQRVQKCTESIRRFLPKSVIVLSTWLNTDTADLDFDECIFSTDPGATIFDDKNGTLQNVNRQIVSSRSGINSSQTRYTVKMRNDLFLIDSNLEKWIERLQKFRTNDSKPSIGAKPVIVTNVTSVNPEKGIKLPFHPCDWIYAGETKDLRRLFDIPLMPESWMRYFGSSKYPDNWPEKAYLSRFPAESYIWSSYVRNHISFDFEHGSDLTESNFELSEKLFSSELIVVPLPLLGLNSSKHKIKDHKLKGMYTYREYRKISQYSADLPSMHIHCLLVFTSNLVWNSINTAKKACSKGFWKSRKLIAQRRTNPHR